LAAAAARHVHLDEHHGRDLLSGELLGLALELDDDHGLLSRTRLDLEGPQLDVALHRRVAELAADEALGVEDGVDGVHRNLRKPEPSEQTLDRNGRLLVRAWFLAASPIRRSLSVKATSAGRGGGVSGCARYTARGVQPTATDLAAAAAQPQLRPLLRATGTHRTGWCGCPGRWR
jgi:hypothetical protein